MNIGVVGIPGKWSTELLADELRTRTGSRSVIDMYQVSYNSAKNTLLYGEQDLADFDALVIKKVSEIYSPFMIDFLDMLTFLQGKGVKIFSKPDSIAQVVNRASCTIRLGAGGIPMPRTIISKDVAAARAALTEYGKAVLKPLFTSKARGMMVVEDSSDAESHLQEFLENGNDMIYMQEFVELPGKDLGLVFLGGEYIGTYARVSAGSWNTTTTSGGSYQAHEPQRELIDLAHKAQALFDLDFTSVDVVETANGPMVFEVSAFGGFRGLQKALGINAAALYADYVVKQMEGGA